MSSKFLFKCKSFFILFGICVRVSFGFSNVRISKLPTHVRVSHRSALQVSSSLLDEISDDKIQDLPIYSILGSIQDSLKKKTNLILEAAPGAGKTSLVPLALCATTSANGDRPTKVIVVEPRRVATRSAAQRMANLINEKPGESVGYLFRGEAKVSSKTKLTVMTDGVLLNKLRDDPELGGIDVVILDEFHERGVGSDTALALLREVQMNFRPDLKIIVMSATLFMDEEDESQSEGEECTGTKLLRSLGGQEGCNIMRSDGRQFPIVYHHAKRSSPLHGVLLNDSKMLVKTMVEAIEEGLQKAPSRGDILAFLPGAKEIRRVVQELKMRRLNGVNIFPLYGSLQKEEQDRAIYKGKSDSRRIIVSSPIAEASLTIEGITLVVDSGFRREPRYDVNTGLPRLITVPCSKDSVIQRAGRAGRMQEGVCIRLFSEGDLSRLPKNALPEICSTDLVPTALLLSDWGCSSISEVIDGMSFVDAPPENALQKAYEVLIDLQAIEEYKIGNSRVKRYRVTPHGQRLIRLPTHPRFASSIAKAAEITQDESNLAAAVITAALMDGETGRGGDANLAKRITETLRDGQNSFHGRNIVKFASRISEEARIAVQNAMNGSLSSSQVTSQIGKALLPGFIDVIGQYKGQASYGGSTYMLSLGRSARLDDMRAGDGDDFIIVVDTSTGDDGKTRIRAYARVDIETLESIAIEKDEIYAVASKGYIVRAKKVIKVGSLELSSSTLPSPPSEAVTETLLDTIASLGGVYKALIDMQSKKDVAKITNLRRRVKLARKLTSKENWPSCFGAFGTGDPDQEEFLISLVEPWLAAAGSLKAIDLYTILYSSLSSDQVLQLDRDFPTHISAPDGSMIPLDYDNEPPIATAKLQQFFGATQSPTVGPPQNAIPISLSLLSPSGKNKPLAQTIDLPFFWKETYPAIRSEMRGRYPKHPWPEDPLVAEPTRLSNKQLSYNSSPSNSAKGEKVDKRKEKRNKRKKK